MVGTRSQAPEDEAPNCHVLDFLHRTGQGTELTVCVHDVRFHIAVDPEDLQADTIRDEYSELAAAVEENDPECSKKGSATRKRKRQSDEKDEYQGETSGEQPDSGYRSSASPPASNTAAEKLESAQRELQNWMLKSFESVFAERAPRHEAQKLGSVYEWYHSPMQFFELRTREDADGEASLNAVVLEANDELCAHVLEAIIPALCMPKYFLDYSIPLFASAGLQIVACSSEPGPYHPSLVRERESGEEYFLKPVDASQPGPTKREIKMLKELEDAGIHERIRVPRLIGLVIDTEDQHKYRNNTTTSDTTKNINSSTILGFLLTPIPSPTPLTLMFDSDIAEDKRDSWSRDCQKAVKTLHEAGFVWGDAKADNFVVDDKANVWMIDFGGSYTEGWIDEELAETVEGDDMAVGKIVRALADPEGETCDPEEAGASAVEEETADVEDETDEEEEEEEVEAVLRKKRRKVSEHETESAETYCYCGKSSSGSMVACDNPKCRVEWFHFECVGLNEPPDSNEKWHCYDCKDNR